MKINLSLKYWGRHKKRAFSVIFAITVSMAALTCAAFLARSSSATNLESQLDISGNYDVILLDITADRLADYQCDDRFSSVGVLYRSGKIFSPKGTEFWFGALDNSAIDLYHSTPETGRYPQKKGEITAFRSFFEANGCYPEIGATLFLSLYDQEGALIKSCELTIVGILDDNDNRVLPGKDNYVFPHVFLSLEDIPPNSATDLLGNYAQSADINEMKKEFRENGVEFFDGGRIMMMNTIALVPITEISEKNLYDSLDNAQKDFYAYALIPIFSCVVLFVAFVSICNAVSTSLAERKHQLAMLRCIGMGNDRVLKMALAESVCMVLIGMILGFVSGIAVYLIVLVIQNTYLHLNVRPAFSVNPVIAATTVNPYLFPAAACFICSILAVLIPYLIQLGKSPTEGLKSDAPNIPNRIWRAKKKTVLLGRLSGGLYQNISLFVIVIVVIWSSVFGYSYFSAQSAVDSQTYQTMLENAQLMGFDYLAERYFTPANCGNAQLNRHNSGISPELTAEISECDSVETFFSCIEARSTKVIFLSDELNDNVRTALSPANLDNNVQKGLEELYEKSLRTQGYLDNEVLFNIPTVGVSDDELTLLSKYLTDGNLNLEKLRSGEEVLIIRTTGTDPFSVGETLSMTDVVIDDPVVEDYDFSSGYIPDGYDPDFYYDYTDYSDMRNLPGYAFGARCDYDVRIGGHIKIDDDDIAGFFQTQGLAGDCGFQILCSENAFSQWGLLDRNLTKIGVRLREHAEIADFEKLWYRVIGNSQDVSSTSQSYILRQINHVESTNMSVFFSIIAIVVILGLVGMSNSINLRVRKQLHAYSVLRAVGCSKAGIISIVLRQGLSYVFFGSITSLIPLGIFEWFRKKAVIYLASGSNAILSQNGRYHIPWQSLFPWRVELFSQPLIWIILTVFLIVCTIILISNILPAIWVVRKNISDALRNDDF